MDGDSRQTLNKDQRRMDCPHYLKQLDAVLPGSEDHEDSGVREAVAHLSECASCAREVEARGEFDRQVAARMRDVAVPVEARVRLLRQLSQADETVTPVSSRAAAHRTWRSLPWKTLVASAACVLIVAWYLVQDSDPQMTMADVDAAVAQQFAGVTIEQYEGLDDFDDSFDATIDDGRWRSVTNLNPRGIDLNVDGDQDAAVYWMNAPVRGVLLVVSPDLVSDPPGNPSAKGLAPLYSPVRVAWLPANSRKVHLIVLNSDADDQDLNRLLQVVIDSLTA